MDLRNARSLVDGESGAVEMPAARFSIVVPLFDCRDAGTRALESALGQDYSDFNAVESEILLFAAGSRGSPLEPANAGHPHATPSPDAPFHVDTERPA